MLERLEDVPWGELKHAYGAATDLPDRLRLVAAGSEDAVGELHHSICHQGTVYQASAFAVPFLVELLESEVAPRTEILFLLQALARGSSYHAVHKRLLRRSKQNTGETKQRIETELGWVRSTHEAVVAGVPQYLRISLDDDTDVDERVAAAFVLSACDEAADVVSAALVARLDREPSNVARAAILHALGELDRVTDEVFDRGIADAAPLPRVMAVLARQPSRELTPPELNRLAESSADAMDSLLELPPVQISGDPLDFVIGAMDERREAQTAVLVAWLRHASPSVRKRACEACTRPADAWRPAAQRLLPSLSQCLADDDRSVRWSAAWSICDLGRAAAPAADALWALIEREQFTIDDSESPAHRAFVSLIRARDPRAGAHLRGVLERLAPAPKSGWQRMLGVLWAGGSVAIPSSVWAVLDHVGPWAVGCLAPLVRLMAIATDHKIAVIDAVGRHGDAAAIAVPALRAQLAACPRVVTHVLGTLGPLAIEALGDVQRALQHDDVYVRVNAARAVWRIGGRADLAVPALRRELMAPAKGHSRSRALEAIAELGPVASDVAPLLPPLFDDDDWVSSRSAIAYWHITRDAERVVEVLVDRHVEAVPRGFEAVRCLAKVGPAARAALPLLRAALVSDRRQAHAAVVGTAIDADEDWRALCETAMRNIEPPS
jgi:hypothetical protein